MSLRARYNIKSIFLFLIIWSVSLNYPSAHAQTQGCKDIQAIPGEFNIDKFLSRIQSDPNLKSVESALCVIPESIRSNYLLVHSSQSAQNSSPQNPRVVLFDKGSQNQPVKYAITFNGDPAHLGYQNLEIISFDINAPAQKQIKFREIQFNPSTGKSHISKENPDKCMSCHKSNSTIARPFWDAVSFFPTVYGQSGIKGTKSNRPDEAKDLKDFIQRSKDHPRYQKLIGLEKHLKYSCTSEQISSKKCFESSESLVAANDAFAARLAIINRRRIGVLIKETPDYKAYRFAILATLVDCPQITKMVPESLHSSHLYRKALSTELQSGKPNRASLDKLQKITNQIFNCKDCRTELPSNIERFETLSPTTQFITELILDTEVRTAQWANLPSRQIGILRWIFEGRQVDMSSWNMDLFFSQGHYRFINGPNGRLSLDLPLLGMEMIESDPELKKTLSQNPATKSMVNKDIKVFEFNPGDEGADSSKQNRCDALKKMSLQAFTDFFPKSPGLSRESQSKGAQ